MQVIHGAINHLSYHSWWKPDLGGLLIAKHRQPEAQNLGAWLQSISVELWVGTLVISCSFV